MHPVLILDFANRSGNWEAYVEGRIKWTYLARLWLSIFRIKQCGEVGCDMRKSFMLRGVWEQNFWCLEIVRNSDKVARLGKGTRCRTRAITVVLGRICGVVSDRFTLIYFDERCEVSDWAERVGVAWVGTKSFGQGGSWKKLLNVKSVIV